MILDFFDAACQEPPLENALFGICDGQNGAKAYTDLHNSSAWIATVKNDARISLTFTAIDKCVVKDRELPGKGRCDGMLHSNDHLYFIELKDQSRSWISEAVEQLKSTIQLFKAHHDIQKYTYKKLLPATNATGISKLLTMNRTFDFLERMASGSTFRQKLS